MSHALIVEDDQDAARAMASLVSAQRYSVATAGSLRAARQQLALQRPDVVLLDLELPDGKGLDLFDTPGLLAHSEVVLITGHASFETSVQALRHGVADYLTKPVCQERLRGILSRAMKPEVLQAEIGQLEKQWSQRGHFGHLWGRSAAMQRVYQQISRVAGTSISVFITGESGTGKEVVARSVHDLSRRRQQPFLAVNCGAISPQLIESEIFGHEKGAFTGADSEHQGFFERAHGGTLFLDEITEMPLELQVKLLRVLETGSFMRVGSTRQRDADVRVIAATNRSPELAVAEHRLREDLLYRLNVFPIALPRLRERREDVALLAEHFLAAVSRREGETRRFLPEALDALAAYDWPGNVRELRNVVQRAYVMTDGDSVSAEWLPTNAGLPLPPRAVQQPAAAALAAAVGAPEPGVLQVRLGSSMAEVERQLILATFHHFERHKERTAAALGISIKTLYNRLKQYETGSIELELDAAAEAEATLPR